MPTTIEATVCQKLSPNRIANAPNTTFVQVRFAPRNTAPRLRGRESRASSGRYSTPAASTAPTRSVVKADLRGREGRGHGLLDSLVDGYINSVDVVFNKDRDSSRGRTEIDRRSARRQAQAARRTARRAAGQGRRDRQAEGLSAVTLRRVAADLGVTPGLVSHYFSSAEQLITAAFRAAAARRSGRGAVPRRRRASRRRPRWTR